jgi:anthranilate 1,2-dioxygenase small subunit
MDGIRELIDSFNGRYTQCIDDGSLTQWPNFFLENCHYRITTAENYATGPGIRRDLGQ